MIRVAIDGPAGAGKSSIAREVAEHFSMIYVDTGAMYRAIALFMSRRGINLSNNAAVISELCALKLSTSYDSGTGQRIFLGDEDVSEAIRQPEISVASSIVSAIPEVRSFLLGVQRDMAKHQSLIMDGRDIGTVVLPEADLKIFLTAAPEARAKRRCLEYLQQGRQADYSEVLLDIIERDRQDSSRSTAPLRQAEDAILIDTTHLDFEGSVEAIEKLIRERLPDVL